ncbi:MAG: hypothetical protein U9O66_03700, partial [Patescibacteria group bacterium]|nr:hypothetical protein [Patescibacteria group bacterium]
MKTKYLIGVALIALVIIMGGIVSICYYKNNNAKLLYFSAELLKQEHGILKTKPINLSNISTEKLAFAKYYSLDPLDIELKTSQYNLPLKTS